MSSALVSVVIPVFQGSQHILDSINSVLNQTWPALEIVVVDDGSTDDTVKCVESITDPRVRLIKLPNGGATRARNVGYAATRGDFIQFLDHDDLIHPRKIEVQMRRLIEECGDCSACATWETFDHSVADAVCSPQRLWRDDAPVDWLLSARGGDGMMPTGAWLTPRHIIERAGLWNEQLPRNPDDDGEFFSRVVLASRRVLFCAEAFYYYRNAGTQNLRMSRSDASVRSLFATQRIYEQRLLLAEDSLRARRAAAHGYAAFLEMIYPRFPELCAEAISAIKRLDARGFRNPGSPVFSLLADRIGFVTALRLRNFLRRAFGRPVFWGLFERRRTPSSAEMNG